MAQASPQAIAEYRRKLAEYQEIRGAFDAEAGAYWSQISEKRRGRNAKRRSGQQITLDDYVLDQAPLYNGPKRPVNPEPEETPERPARKPLPVVADLLRAAQDLYQFTPQRPANEVEFKRVYARYALASGRQRSRSSLRVERHDTFRRQARHHGAHGRADLRIRAEYHDRQMFQRDAALNRSVGLLQRDRLHQGNELIVLTRRQIVQDLVQM